MRLVGLLLSLTLVRYASASGEASWCYTGCEQTPNHWQEISGAHCGGTRQSPLNIVTADVVMDPKLLDLSIANFDSKEAIKSINFTAHTVKCVLEVDDVEVMGGGLDAVYSTIQLHFHWGDNEHHPGSEHTVDGRRYPMEMHVVSLKKGLSVQQAVDDPEGIAVLGFFIDAVEDESASEPWEHLTSRLMNTTGSTANLSNPISIKDLVGEVDLNKFYRYMGSLTTPMCNQAVVWTVFKEPINVNKTLVERFPARTALTNAYRPTQAPNGRTVFASPGTLSPSPPVHTWCYDNHCGSGPSEWYLLPQAKCNGERQSPVNIEVEKTALHGQLGAFTFTQFDNKQAIDYIVNTGHTVKCVLKEDLVRVSGGGLGFDYTVLQFHFHWGDPSQDHQGSEHMLDSKRYPMEMHIVTKRVNMSVADALADPGGLAVLGFFIQAADTNRSHGGSEGEEPPHADHTPVPGSDSNPWWTLTSYLMHVQNAGLKVRFQEEVSLDDLLGEVDRRAYYRYNGSLTTPTCDEAVVWTVFKTPIKVDKELMTMFPVMMQYQDVFRPNQSLGGRTVYRSSSDAASPRLAALLLPCFLVLAAETF